MFEPQLGPISRGYFLEIKSNSVSGIKGLMNSRNVVKGNLKAFGCSGKSVLYCRNNI